MEKIVAVVQSYPSCRERSLDNRIYPAAPSLSIPKGFVELEEELYLGAELFQPPLSASSSPTSLKVTVWNNLFRESTCVTSELNKTIKDGDKAPWKDLKRSEQR